MKNDTFDLWMRRPAILKILLFIDNKPNLYCSLISRRINICYRTCWLSIKFLKDNGLIINVKKNKIKRGHLCLTEKGKLITEKLNELDILFKNI